MYYYIDESGWNEDYVFVAVGVENKNIPQQVINIWRKWMKNRIKGFNQNEYHDYFAKDIEKKKVLNEIANYNGDICFWAIIKKNYNGRHKELYAETISELLKHCRINENDVIIALDCVEKSKTHMEKHIRQIKKILGMPNLNISYTDSQKEKGIQLADAIAGAVSREYLQLKKNSLYEIVIHQMIADILII